MSTIPLHIPPGINYECTSCGKCCGGWAVPMTETDWDRISEVDWSGIHPTYATKELFRELKPHEKADTPYTHKIVSDSGVCSFLVNDLCAMHSKYGAEFKPSICQLFPYCFSVTPTGIYATISFVSMGAIYNSGKPLLEQRPLLEHKLGDFNKLYPDHAPDWSQIKLTVDQPITWDQYLEYEQQLLIFLDDKSISMEKRLLNGSHFLASKVTRPGAAGSRTAGNTTDASAKALKKLDKDLLVTFHNMYYPAKMLKRGETDFNTVRLVMQHFFGSKKLTILPGQAFEISELHDFPWPENDKEIDDILYRYFYSYIFGKKYFGAGFGQVSVIAGFHHLIVMFALLKLHAKAVAIMRSAPIASLIDVAASVRQLERQVGETKLGGYSAATWELMLFSPLRAERILANT